MKWKGHARAALLIVLLCMAFSALTSAESPSWWTTRGVLNTNWSANDFAPVLAGQLKWMATNAAAELETLPGGAGTGVHALVSGFTLSNNYVPINLGQLKNTAAPFYQRLMAVGYATNYPWTEDTADDSDFAPAVLGQLKYVFDFDVSADLDEDALPDWWETFWFGGLTNWTGGSDADDDELSNLLEYQEMTSPTNSDTDTDGMPDGWEVGYSLDPLSDDSTEDPDNDGLSNLGEYNAGTDPLNGGDPGFLRPVSFRVTTSSPKLYICEVDMTTNTDVCGHLNDMTLCTQQEAEEGRESCDNTYEGDSGRGDSHDTYTTFFRGGSDNVKLILDSWNGDGGSCATYSGSLKLYRGIIVSWTNYGAVSDGGTHCTVSRISSNEISWSVFLDGSNCGPYGSGGCYPMIVNWRRPTNDLSMTPWIDILPTNHVFMCAGCSNSETLTAQPYGVTSANYTWSITPSGGAYFSGSTTGTSVNVMAGNNPGDYIVQCRPVSNMNLCVLGSATVTVLEVELEELTFSDNAGFTADNAAWISVGNQKWTPTYKTSVLFTEEDEKAKINTKLKVTPQLSSAVSMTIQGTADNGMTFTKTFDFPASTTSYTVNDIEASAAFGTAFDYIGGIEWTVTFAGCEQDLPETDNNIYYVPGGVEPSLHIDTILYNVCCARDGSEPDDSSATLGAIWGVFSDLSVIKADRATTLKYWSESGDDSRNSVAALLDDDTGNCEAWASLMAACLVLAGKTDSDSVTLVSVDRGLLDPANDFEVLANNAQYNATGVDYGHGSYQWKIGDAANAGEHEWSGSVAGQGGTPVVQEFLSHQVVKIGSSHYYDPSYGQDASTLKSLEDQILGGILQDFAGAPAGWYSRPNTTANNELKEW